MTQYDDIVEKQRQINAAEVWAKKVKQIYAHDGIIETWYYNGDIRYEENRSKGRRWLVKGDLNQEKLVQNFEKYQVDKGV
jgi:hypothetical protein